jgi:asparagine synthase (glutamine-hydrolysing)
MRDRLPPEILTRSKMGFGVPVGDWLRTELRPLLEDTLLSSRALQRGYFRPQAVHALVDEHTSRRADRTSHIWALLMLELWFREFVDVPAHARADDEVLGIVGLGNAGPGAIAEEHDRLLVDPHAQTTPT